MPINIIPVVYSKRSHQNKFINNFKIDGSREELIPLRGYKANALLACLVNRRIGVMENLELVIKMAEEIRGDLATAFGGFSQFTEEEIITALKGRYNNGNEPFYRCEFATEVLIECLNQEEERWEGLTETPERAEYWYAKRKVITYEFQRWLEQQNQKKVGVRISAPIPD